MNKVRLYFGYFIVWLIFCGVAVVLPFASAWMIWQEADGTVDKFFLSNFDLSFWPWQKGFWA